MKRDCNMKESLYLSESSSIKALAGILCLYLRNGWGISPEVGTSGPREASKWDAHPESPHSRKFCPCNEHLGLHNIYAGFYLSYFI